MFHLTKINPDFVIIIITVIIVIIIITTIGIGILSGDDNIIPDRNSEAGLVSD